MKARRRRESPGPTSDYISGFNQSNGEFEFFNNGRMPRFHKHPLRGGPGSKAKRTKIQLNMVPRGQWGALPNKDEMPVDHPVKNVRYIQTSTDQCSSREECDKLVQGLQAKHMEEGMADIQYNFLIATDGTVYEGRGWAFDASRDVEFEFLEEDCFDIAYIGTFDRIGENIPEVMKTVGKTLADYGVARKFVDCCYREIFFNTDVNSAVIKQKLNN